jgi:hypothetical protein
MNVSGTSGIYSSYVMQTVLASASSSAPPPADTGEDQPTTRTAELTPLSGAMLPRVQLPADQLAMLQSGAAFKAPDPAKTEAEMNTPASAVVRDASTGEILGGVWPNVATVSAPTIAADPRLSSASNSAQQAQYLAQDIQQATGRAVTIQYFQPGDPNAPTFGSNVLGSYAAF